MAGLTPKQERFVAEYLVDLNATAAAGRAGYKDPNIGRQLITKNNVAEAIQAAQRARQERTEVTQDMVVRECARLAFFDARKMFDENGKPLDISQLDDDTAAALVGLDVQDVMDGDGDFVGYVKKYKMADKLKALELLGKHLGIFTDKAEANVKLEGSVEVVPLSKRLAQMEQIAREFGGEHGR